MQSDSGRIVTRTETPYLDLLHPDLASRVEKKQAAQKYAHKNWQPERSCIVREYEFRNSMGCKRFLRTFIVATEEVEVTRTASIHLE